MKLLHAQFKQFQNDIIKEMVCLNILVSVKNKSFHAIIVTNVCVYEHFILHLKIENKLSIDTKVPSD